MASPEIKIYIKGVDEVSQVLKQVASSIDEIGRGAGAAAAETSSFSDKLSGLKDIAKIAAGVLIADLARDALGALTDALGKAGQQFAELEWTLTAIVKASGETGEVAEQLYASLEEVSKAQTDLGFTSVEAAGALEALVKAGMEGEEAAKALSAALSMARIESIDTAEASNLLVGVMNQFGYSAEQAAQVVDILVNASVLGVDAASDFGLALSYCGAQAASMGLSLEETTAALVAINNQGIAAEKAGRYLASMFSDLIAKSDKLGFSIYDVNGQLLPLHKIIGRLVKKLKSFGTQAERDAYLSKIFGAQSRRAALSLLNLGDETKSAGQVLAELTEQMGKTGTATDTVNALMNTAKGRMMRLEAEISNANESLGAMTMELQLAWKQFALGLGPIGAVADALGPSLLQAAISGVMIALPQLITTFGGLTGILSGVKAAFASLNAVMMANPIMLVVTAIGALIAILVTAYQTCEPFRNAINAIGSAIYDFLKPAIDAITGALQWLWQNVVAPFIAVLRTLWDVITNNPILAALFGPITTIAYLIQNWDQVTQALGATWQAVTSAISGFWNTYIKPIANFIWTVIQVYIQAWISWLQQLGNIWNAVCSAISGFWNTYIKPIVDFIWGVIQAAFNFWISLIQQVQSAWQVLCEAIGWWWNNIVMPVVNVVKQFVDAIKGAFDWLFGWLFSGKWNQLCQGIVDVWNTVVMPLVSVVRGFVDSIAGAFNWLKDTLSGIWNSIVSGVQSAFSAIQNAIGTAVNAVGDALSGFANAIGDAMSGAWDAISGFISSICFAHAIHEAVVSSLKDLELWENTLKEKMNTGIKTIKGFTTEIGEPVLKAPPIRAVIPEPAPAGPITVNITIQGVNEEIARYVRRKLVEDLKNVLRKPTSMHAPTEKIILPRRV